MSTYAAAPVRRMRRSHLEAFVARAAHAPSSHNTQPWRFRVTGAGIDLIADRRRSLPINDPGGRELTISCGCALFNLRCAAADAGVALDVEVLPDPLDRDLLARATLFDGEEDEQLAALARQIDRRHTYRGRMLGRAGVVSAEALHVAAGLEGARLIILRDDDARSAFAALVGRGDAVQWSSGRWRSELAEWIRPRSSGDGLSVPGAVAGVARRVVRRFDLGRTVGRRDARSVHDAPIVAILTTQADDPEAWLAAGQALQRVLLTGAQSGLQASYFNQPIQVPKLRDELQGLCDGRWPQIAFRMGRPAGATAASPRRRLHQVLSL